MISNKILAFVFFSFFALHPAHSAHHFTEVYSDGGSWRVDHFQVDSGKLQEFVSSHSFPYEAEARAYASGITKVNSSKSLSSIKLVTTEKNTTPLWVVKNSWSDEWEEKYSKWITENLDQNFFVKYQLATDCADVAYAMRWIFARNNNLPVVATLAGSGLEVSHLSARNEWANLPGSSDWHNDQRFRAALNWLLENVYTQTLFKDTYPVAISKKTIVAGLINLLGGHTEIFNKVSYSEDELPLYVVSSTVPREIRELALRPFFDEEVTNQSYGGLVAFRRLILKNNSWTALPKESMPDYSLEQYGSELCEDESAFARCLFKKLGMSYKPDLVFEKITLSLEESIRLRSQIVDQGHTFCQSNDCTPGSVGWEDWSTPSRDKRLKQAFESASSLSSSLSLSSRFSQWSKGKINSDPEATSFGWFNSRLEEGLVSYDPRDPPKSRWAANAEAINVTANSVFKNGDLLRRKLIDQAKQCRETPEQCRKSLKDYKELSTVEVDGHVNTVLSSWMSFCEWTVCPTDKKLETAFEHVWKQSPLPWDSLDERFGLSSQTKDAHFLKASRTSELFEDYLILDDKKVYSIKTKKMISLPVESVLVGYIKDLNLLYVFDGDDFYLLNSNFEIVSTIKMGLDGNQVKVHKLSSAHYVVLKTAPDRSFESWYLNFSSLSSSSLGHFTQRLTDTKTTSKHILLSGAEKSTHLTIKNDQLVQKDYPALDGAVNFFGVLHADQFLVAVEKDEMTTLFKVSPSEVLALTKSDHPFKNFRVNDQYLSVAYYGEEENFETLLIDSKGVVKVFGDEVSLGPSAFSEHYFMTTFSPHHQPQLSLIGPTGIVPLPVFLRDDEFVISASPQWISLVGTSGGRVIDYKGQAIENPKYAIKGVCGGLFSTFCTDQGRGEVELNYFASSLTGISASLTQVARADNKMGLLYLMDKNSPQYEIGFWPDSEEPNRKTEKGFEVRLNQHALYWFPK